MSIATDVRTYADTALAQGKVVLSQAGSAVASANKRLVVDAPKPAYAALGAADLVATKLSKRVESLPGDAFDNVTKAQRTSRTLINRTQDETLARLQELRGRLDASFESVSTLPVVAKQTTEGYLSTAKDLYGKLTVRGEAKAAELRTDPRLAKLFGLAEVAGDVADSVQDSVRPVVKSAFDTVQAPLEAVSSRQAKASKPAARKSTASKATASKATASKPAAKRAPRKAASKSTATKASTTEA